MIYNPIIVQQNGDAIDLSKLQETGTRLVDEVNLETATFTETLPVNSSCDQYIHLTLTQGRSYWFCDDRWYKLSKTGEFTNIYTSVYGQYYSNFVNNGRYLVATYSNGSLQVRSSGVYQGVPMLTAQFYVDVSSLKAYSGTMTIARAQSDLSVPWAGAVNVSVALPFTLSGDIVGKTPQFITISNPASASNRFAMKYYQYGNKTLSYPNEYPILIDTSHDTNLQEYAITVVRDNFNLETIGWNESGSGGTIFYLSENIQYTPSSNAFVFNLYNATNTVGETYDITIQNLSFSGYFDVTYYCLE